MSVPVQRAEPHRACQLRRNLPGILRFLLTHALPRDAPTIRLSRWSLHLQNLIAGIARPWNPGHAVGAGQRGCTKSGHGTFARSRRQPRANFAEQTLHIHRLGIEVAAPDGHALLAVAGQGVRRQRDDRNCGCGRIGLDQSGSLPSHPFRQAPRPSGSDSASRSVPWLRRRRRRTHSTRKNRFAPGDA